MTLLTTTASMLLAALAFTPARAADATAKPERPKTIKVLMIGNSQCPLIVNNHLIENLAKSNNDGPLIEITGCVKGGATLKSHWDNGTGPKSAREMIAGGKWNFVVLQEIYNIKEEDMRPYAVLFHDMIKNNGAQTVLFGTASNISDYPKGFERLHQAHLNIGNELNVPIVDASYAYFKYLGDKPSAEKMESLFAKDKAHPGMWGSYIYTCGIYSVVTGRSPVGLTGLTDMPAEVAKALQEAAWAQHQETTNALKK